MSSEETVPSDPPAPSEDVGQQSAGNQPEAVTENVPQTSEEESTSGKEQPEPVKEEPPPPLQPLSTESSQVSQITPTRSEPQKQKEESIIPSTPVPAPVVDNRDSSSSEDEDIRIARERKEKFATGKDYFCWICHRDGVNISCVACPRSYHVKCIPVDDGSLDSKDKKSKRPVVTIEKPESWTCTDCKLIESGNQRRKTVLTSITDDEFVQLLKYALQTIKQTSEPSFHNPVKHEEFPVYRDFILHPMDFSTMYAKLRKNEYKSTDEFLADVKWILHNSYIYNDSNHILTKNAKYFIKVAQNEMSEIEVCPDCFNNFYVYPKSWFMETCSRPHTLVWARLKGHPFWPAKVVRLDRSESYPWTKSKGHKTKLDTALGRVHIEKLEKKFPGLFLYAPPKTPFNPSKPFLNSEENEDEMNVESSSGKSTQQQSTTATTTTQATESSGEASIDGSSAAANQPRTTTNNRKNNRTSSATISKTNELNRRSKGQQAKSSNSSSSIVIQRTSQQQRKRSNDSSASSLSLSQKRQKTTTTSTTVASFTTNAETSESIDDQEVMKNDEDDDDERPLIIADATPIDADVSSVEGGGEPRRKTSGTSLSNKKSTTPVQSATTSTASSSRTSGRGGNNIKSGGGIPAVSTSRIKPLSSNLTDTGSAQPIDGNKKRGRTTLQQQQQKRTGSLLPQQASASSSVGDELTVGTTRKKVNVGKSIIKTSSTTQSNHANDERNGDTPDVVGTKSTTSRRMVRAPTTSSTIVDANVASTSATSTTTGQQQQVTTSSPATATILDKNGKKQPMTNNIPSNGSGSLLSSTKGGSSLIAKNNIVKKEAPVAIVAPSIGNNNSEVKLLKTEIEKLKLQNESLKKELSKRSNTIQKLTQEKIKAEESFARQLDETKRRQWCAACLREAIYFCCWNTSYCSYECQSKHWPHHMPNCQQASRQQQQQQTSSASTATEAGSKNSFRQVKVDSFSSTQTTTMSDKK